MSTPDQPPLVIKKALVFVGIPIFFQKPLAMSEGFSNQGSTLRISGDKPAYIARLLGQGGVRIGTPLP